MKRQDHIPALDGIRGFASLLVVASHLDRVGFLAASPQFAGAIGVMLFFVLSGFLMAHLYLWKPFDRPAYIHYLAARVGRVVPLYWLVLVVSLILSKIFGEQYTFYLTNWQFFRQATFWGSFYVFWSIPPEMQFYVLFVLIWAAIFSDAVRRYAPFFILGLGIILISRPLLPGISALGQLQIFLTGVCVAALRRGIGVKTISSSAASVIQIASVGAILLVVSGVVPIRNTHLVGAAWSHDDAVYASLPVAVLFGAMMLAFSIETKFANALFGNRLASKIGGYSFSIYLIHEPVMSLIRGMTASAGMPWAVQLMLALAAVFVVSAVSLTTFELPAQRFVRRMIVR